MSQASFAFPDAPGVGWTWIKKNPLCLWERHCGRGAWVGPWEPLENAWHRDIVAVNCTCRGGQSQPTRPREGA